MLLGLDINPNLGQDGSNQVNFDVTQFVETEHKLKLNKEEEHSLKQC